MPRRDQDAVRPTVARHATLPTPSPLSSFLKFLGIALGVVVVSAVAVGAYLVVDVFNRVGDDAVALEGAPEVEPPSLGAYPADQAFSILVVGTDECGEKATALFAERCEEADGLSRNDVNLLVHVSAEPRNVTVVSLPRDLMIEVPECTREDGTVSPAMAKASINSVFDQAGLSCVAKTVSDLADIPIGFAAKLSFDGVMAITEAIGGVEVCIAGDGIRDRHTGLNLPPGTHTISGVEALQFIRTRHGVGDESDLARISNQQQYMSRLAKKVLSEETLTDVPKVLRLANAIADNIVPSEELRDPLRLAQLALALNDVPFSDFVFVQYPNLEDPDDSNRVVPNYEAADALWAALKSGQPVQLTGDVATHEGVELVTPAPTQAPAPTATAGSETTSPPVRATLPPDISGQTLEQETCSVGNQR
ncbi:MULTISPECIES: LCP family protein [unclassified Microbacterium]|uniref:LCP family protein n=1 Tax=unclassified Microbacterium TaxID=2609290 RepID=UPI000EA9973A|nr:MULTISPECIES: LCP family protein [unclassified Microbacterium]MBT2484939.1 LCP family protein [Microbacterium sp. ISL-108]RKN67799.1 LytR family transcriptional regulator [Microbacterium sp. CGR2]